MIIQVETQEAVDNIEEIVAIPGVDVTLVGPTDLSIALGVPGQLDSPKLHAAIEKMIDACRRHDVFPALHINDLDWAVHWVKKGMRVLSSFSEAGLMMRGGLTDWPFSAGILPQTNRLRMKEGDYRPGYLKVRKWRPLVRWPVELPMISIISSGLSSVTPSC